MTRRETEHANLQLGLRANLPQFALLVAVNALVGGMIGQERTVLPLLATKVFGLTAFTSALTFIVAFGAVKAVTNFFAGTLSDRVGRKPVLVTGWLIGLPVPLLLMWAPSWGWIIVANVLLGVNQGLTWSTTVIMKIDLVGPERRGLAMGLNEAAGYGAVAVTALATGLIAARYGLRPEPFFLGVAYVALGLGLSTLFVRETQGYAHQEARDHVGEPHLHGGLSTREVFVLTSFRERALSSCSQAGLVNNLNDGLAWGIFPLFFAEAAGLSIARIGVLAALYPAVWGLDSSSPARCRTASDASGSSPPECGSRPSRSASSPPPGLSKRGRWARCSSARAPPWSTPPCSRPSATSRTRRGASAVGVYRLWRDAGFAIGALLAGVVADALGLDAAIWTVAALTAASGVVVAIRMYETHQTRPDNQADTPIVTSAST